VFDEVVGHRGFVRLPGREIALLSGGNLEEIGYIWLSARRVMH
jgi:hypothetical protein